MLFYSSLQAIYHAMKGCKQRRMVGNGLLWLIHLLSVFVWNLQTWCFCRHQQPGSLHQIPESVIVHIWVSIGIGFVLQWTCKAWFDWAVFLWPMQTDVFQLEVFGFVVANVSRIGTCKKCSKSFSVGNRDISTLHLCCCGCMKVLFVERQWHIPGDFCYLAGFNCANM